MSWIVRFYKYVVTWRAHRLVIKELNALSDAQLKDIGLNRGDIDNLIWLKLDKQRRGSND